jgi:hypothetical protein
MMPPVPHWYLVFEHAESVWWHKYLKPGYAHCWAFGFSPAGRGEAGRWIMFDPAFDGLQVRLLAAADVDLLFVAAARGAVRLLRMPVVAQAVVRPRWAVTCAGALAALVGMGATPLTPWGLACTARRLGAVEALAEGVDAGFQGAAGAGARAECRGAGGG